MPLKDTNKHTKTMKQRPISLILYACGAKFIALDERIYSGKQERGGAKRAKLFYFENFICKEKRMFFLVYELTS